MPIVNYEQLAETAYKYAINHPKISEANKEHIRRFDKAYRLRVKPATRSKFWRHLPFFLEKTDDITSLFDNPDEVNKLFAELRATLTPGYYGTMVNCVNAFARWLNDDIKPRGFKDIKSPKKGEQRRKLSKADMWEWEDGLRVAEGTTSTQFRALLMTQLNLGARPSELIDLNYGDIEIKGKLAVVNIRAGKTGARQSIIYYAVPYLLRWLEQHPTKQANAPLWIVENAKYSHIKAPDGSYKTLNEGGVRRVNYQTLRTRLRYLCNKAGVKKKTDFYTLRHSCARLLRLWKLPVEECAKHLGHSVKEFTETYGRLDTKDREQRHAKAYGVEIEEEEDKTPGVQTCKRCSSPNTPEADFCARCSAPLSVVKALELEREAQDKAEKLDVELGRILELMLRNPEFLQKLEALKATKNT